MAEVFEAREPQTAGEPRTVVVKRMLPHIAAEPNAERMFEEEATLGAFVRHANVVRVLGYGRAAEQPYLALELVRGTDLHRILRWLAATERTMPPEIAIFIGCELLAGLHAIHEACDESGSPLGIVHGDVTPSNVLISSRGDVKLGDFGIAEARLRTRFPQAAAAGRTRGKLGYLAPEQVRGAARDRRADVFAATVVTTELLLGRPLFARGTELAILLAVRDARVEPLLERAHDLPKGLCEVLLIGLARDPERRAPTAAALRKKLLPFCGGGSSATKAALGAIVVEAMRTATRSAVEPSPDEVTIEPSLDVYSVERRDGEALGPMSFAQLVEAVATGRAAAHDRVRIGSGPARELGELTELADHFPRSPAPSPSDVPPSDQRDLSAGGIVDALARSTAARADGVWVCDRGPVRKEVYLVGGTPEFVSSNLSQELLGEFLVARGVLDRGELDMALAVLPRFDGRLGDTLAALGLVEPVQLFQHIAEQVREKLLELFTWDEGQARFYDGVQPPKRYFPLGLDPWRLLHEGMERRFAEGLEQAIFARSMTARLERTPEAPPEELPDEVDQVLDLTRAARPLKEVVQALEDPSERDVHRAYRAIRLALALGLVRWSAPA